jgi:hypothetical protein
VLGRVEQLFGPAERIVKPPRLEDIALAPPWLDPPPSLPFCSTVLCDRVGTYLRQIIPRLCARSCRRGTPAAYCALNIPKPKVWPFSQTRRSQFVLRAAVWPPAVGV